MIEQSVYRTLVGTSLRGVYHSLSHAALEKTLKLRRFESILEVGAGEGEHFKYVKSQFESYILTDINELSGDINIYDERVKFQQANVENLSFALDDFDRVIVTCVLHHLERPDSALKEIRRVTKDGGVVSILLPSDPGWFFRVVRRITSDRFLRSQGINDVAYIRAVEHRNHVSSLENMIRYIFKNDTIQNKRYPVAGLSWNLTLFSVFQITINKKSKPVVNS